MTQPKNQKIIAIIFFLLAGMMAVVTAFSLQRGESTQRDWGLLGLAGLCSLLTFLFVQLALKFLKKSKKETQVEPPLPEYFLPKLQSVSAKSQGFISLTTACVVTGQGMTETQKLLDHLVSLHILVKSRSEKGNSGYKFIQKEDLNVRN